MVMPAFIVHLTRPLLHILSVFIFCLTRYFCRLFTVPLSFSLLSIFYSPIQVDSSFFVCLKKNNVQEIDDGKVDRQAPNIITLTEYFLG